MISSELIYNNNVEIDIVLYPKASPSSMAVRNTKIYLTTSQPNIHCGIEMHCLLHSYHDIVMDINMVRRFSSYY